MLISGLFLIQFVFAEQKDAIGVRIMANTEHFPAAIWYQKQAKTNPSFSSGGGTPIQVDGYDGIKEGRTVYVNALNVVHPEIKAPYFCASEKDYTALLSGACAKGVKQENFYSNIYVITYNGNAGAEMENIFSQILANWKFNTNINLNTLCYNNCKDATSSLLYSGQQEVDEARSALRRDSRRLADMSYMQWVFEKYFEAYGKYPTLEAGTYIAGETLSLWPSWQETLGAQLGIALPYDPVNSFYPFEECPESEPDCYCDGYDPATCWDQKSRLFNGADSILGGLDNTGHDYKYTDGSGKIASLRNALVYYYRAYGNGASYEFNAKNWETPYIGESYILEMQAVRSDGNTKPMISNISKIKISPNDEIIVDIMAYDNDAFTEKLAWEFNTPPFSGKEGEGENVSCEITDLTSPAPCCIEKVELLDHPALASKLYGNFYKSYKKLKITSNNISSKCEGKIYIKVKDDGVKNLADSEMESAVYPLEVEVSNQAPVFISGIGDTYSAEIVVGYDWEGYFIKAQDMEDDILTYEILTKPDWIFFEGLDENAIKKDSSAGVKILGIPSIAETYIFNIQAKDSKEGIVSRELSIIVTNQDPVISSFPEDQEKHINENNEDENFSYQIDASDSDGHELTYSMTCESEKSEADCGDVLSIDSEKGKISSPDNFTISDFGEYKFTVNISDGYEGEAEESFSLKITPFCGNDVVENWEDGGIVEECDFKKECCVGCKWACPPYNTIELIPNDENRATAINNSGDLLKIPFPACRAFESKSLKIDAKVEEVTTGTVAGADIVFVTDVSGSMGLGFDDKPAPYTEQRIYYARNSLTSALEQLKESSVASKIGVGLVAFDGAVIDSSPVRNLTSQVDYDFLQILIQALVPRGSTNIAAGIKKGLEFLKFDISGDTVVKGSDFDDNRDKIIILLADGNGTAPSEELLTSAKSYSNFKIYTIALTNTNSLDQMCAWSSDNGNNCWRDNYSYKGTDNLNVMYSVIIGDIVNSLKPEDIVIKNSSGKIITTVQPDVNNNIFSIDLSEGVICSEIEQDLNYKVEFSGGGRMKFFNARINYCPFCAP
ncbi:MAG: vWA domain-containing protein [bacterium]